MTSALPFTWTTGALSTLRTMYLAKVSYERIGDDLGCSRSAISGKVRRMIAAGELPRLHERAPVDRARVRAMIAAKEPPIEPEPLPVHDPEPIPDTAISLLEAKDKHCRFPVNDRPFMVCGDTVAFQFYCRKHMLVAYTPATVDRRTR